MYISVTMNEWGDKSVVASDQCVIESYVGHWLTCTSALHLCDLQLELELSFVREVVFWDI